MKRPRLDPAAFEQVTQQVSRGGVPDAADIERFYEALASVPESLLVLEAREPLRQALRVAGRPPLHDAERAETALHALVGDPTFRFRGDAATALAALWSHRPPTDANLVTELVGSDALPDASRVLLAPHAGQPELMEWAVGLVGSGRVAFGHDDVVAFQEYLLREDPLGEERSRLLEELHVNASWTDRRLLLRQLEPEHAHVLPTLARVARRGDPTTRRALVGALDRIGHMSAEPILVSMLDTLDDRTLEVAAEVLGRLGTLRSVHPLTELRATRREASGALGVAIGRIMERFPGGAGGGALTLTEGGSSGALSMVGASSGDIALYEGVEQGLTRVEAPTSAPAPLAARVEEAHWLDLAPGPRPVGLGLRIHAYGMGQTGWALLGWMLAAGTLPGVFIALQDASVEATSGGVVMLLVALLCGAALVTWIPKLHAASQQSFGLIDALGHGRPTLVELEADSIASATHERTFEYLDDDDRLRRVTQYVPEARREVTRDHTSIALYDPESGHLRFAWALPGVVMDERGMPHATPATIALGLIGPLVFVASFILSMSLV